jgi:hypothetical protein
MNLGNIRTAQHIPQISQKQEKFIHWNWRSISNEVEPNVRSNLLIVETSHIMPVRFAG